MTLAQALLSSTQLLHLNGIDDSHIQARVLLQNILNLRPAQLFSERDYVLKKDEVERLWRLIYRRLQNEPLAYLVGDKEFYGYNFHVDSRVLIPRPETELIVEAVLELTSSLSTIVSSERRELLIADIGTGCGAIAITLALKLPNTIIYATDISRSSLQVAQMNCRRYHLEKRVVLLHGNLLKPIPQPVDIIVANLPYIRNADLKKLSPEIACFEPLAAISGGEDGLYIIGELLKQLNEKTLPHTSLFLEIGEGQDVKLPPLLKQHAPTAQYSFIADYNEINRVIKITFNDI